MEVRRTAFIPVGLLAATLLFPCGSDFSLSFSPARNTEDTSNLEHGKLGLLTPVFGKQDELLAYRSLSGLTLDSAATNFGRKASIAGAGFPDSPIQTWTKARIAVSPPPEPHRGMSPGYVDPYRQSRILKDVYYLNCLDDSFLTAAHTLADRRQKYHDDSLLSSWAQAQDLVFANCSGEFTANGEPAPPVYPADPDSALSALVRADRLYQIAAAHFYSEDFDGAEKLFRAIAEDRTSPWRSIAEYMVGRTLLREFSLANKTSAADAARVAFQQIASDPAAGNLRDSARGLVEHLNALDHSAETLQSLSDQLMAPTPGASFGHTMEQAQYILVADAFRPVLSEPDIPEPFDWVGTLESGDEAHALVRWRSTNSLPWLTLSLMYASGKDDATADLLAAAKNVSDASPAYVTTRYNALRLQIERGETGVPRAELDRLLANETSQPASVRNAWRALRTQVATSFDDFLHWAPRIPTNGANVYGGARQSSPVLAYDSVAVLNYGAPLSKIAQAVVSPRLPAWSASQLALTAWTRAFLLNDDAAMKTLAPLLAKNHPDWTPDLTPASGADADAWRFRASLLIARNAQFTPTFDVDFRKPLATNDSWWCAVDPQRAAQRSNEDTVSWRISSSMKAPAGVFSPAEQAEAKKEIERLEKSGSAQSVVGLVILAWAKAHPDDTLVPEALHRVVRVVRYGCYGDRDNARLSKAAFDLLHRRYPQNPWTAKTPYWFN